MALVVEGVMSPAGRLNGWYLDDRLPTQGAFQDYFYSFLTGISATLKSARLLKFQIKIKSYLQKQHVCWFGKLSLLDWNFSVEYEMVTIYILPSSICSDSIPSQPLEWHKEYPKWSISIPLNCWRSVFQFARAFFAITTWISTEVFTIITLMGSHFKPERVFFRPIA